MKKKEGKYEENKLSNISYEKKMCFFAKKKKEGASLILRPVNYGLNNRK